MGTNLVYHCNTYNTFKSILNLHTWELCFLLFIYDMVQCNSFQDNVVNWINISFGIELVALRSSVRPALWFSMLCSFLSFNGNVVILLNVKGIGRENANNVVGVL